MDQRQHLKRILDHNTDTVRLVQLTDTHLCQSSGGTLLGMDTDQSLQAVIDLVHAEREQVDLVLATGDLSDHGYREAYQRLMAYLDQLGPNFWLPGNHDDRTAMNNALGDEQRLAGEIQIANWQILMLDSQVPGEVGGELGAVELEFLAQALERAQDEGLHSLVCLHHQPVAIGSAWLDQQMVADAETFLQIIDRYQGVKAVLWGHVHQQIDRRRGNKSLLASPSTCVQFAPGFDAFKADDRPPGYRWLDLHADGRLETGVSRVRDRQFKVDLDSDGYL